MSNNKKGMLLILLSAFCFSAMAIIVKLLQDTSTGSIVFVRFATGVLSIILIWPLIKKVKLNNPYLLILRGLLGGWAIYLFFYTVQNLGLARGSLIIYTYPVFASLGSTLFLKEQISKLKWLFILLAIIGLAIFSYEGIVADSIYHINPIDFFFGILGSIVSGLAIVTVKKLHDSDNSVSIFFMLCLTGAFMFVPSALKANWIFDASTLGMMIAIGIIATIGQLSMTEAYRYIHVSLGSLMQLLVPVFNMFIGVLIFKEFLVFSEAIGSIIIIVSCLLLLNEDKVRTIIKTKRLKTK